MKIRTRRMVYMNALVVASTDPVVHLPGVVTSVGPFAGPWRGSYRTCRGEWRQCDHDHPDDESALACGFEGRARYLERREDSMRRARRRPRYRRVTPTRV